MQMFFLIINAEVFFIYVFLSSKFQNQTQLWVLAEKKILLDGTVYGGWYWEFLFKSLFLVDEMVVFQPDHA